MLNAAIHLIAAFAFLRSSFQLLVTGLVLVFIAVSWRSMALSERRKLGTALTLDADGTLRVKVPGGEIQALPEPTSTDFGWALWLHWEGSRGQRLRRRVLRGRWMLLPDSMDEEAWRELRIWFRHVAKPALHASDAASPEQGKEGSP